jgi:hypothetical protein
MQFKILGNPLRNRLWRSISKIAQNKIKKTEDSIIDVKNVSFPSPYCILVRYEVINVNEKYEIVIQGEFVDKYKEWKEKEEPSMGVIDETQLEILIRTNHERAKKIGIDKKQ